MSDMNETPFFFEAAAAGQRLFGVLHAPTGPASGRTFVFCHPLTEEKLWTHRVFTSFARSLAAAGHSVLRYDARGNGDSDGEFSDVSLTTLRADARSAIVEAVRRTGVQRVTLLGLRAGAVVASLAAEDVPDLVERLILWAPLTDGGRYMQELLRINLSGQMAAHKDILFDREALVAQMQQGQTVNIEGYEMAWPLYDEMSAIKPGMPRHFDGPCLVVQVERRSRPDAELQQVADAYGGRAVLASAEEEPFWKEIARFYEQAPNLFRVTREWLG